MLFPTFFSIANHLRLSESDDKSLDIAAGIIRLLLKGFFEIFCPLFISIHFEMMSSSVVFLMTD